MRWNVKAISTCENSSRPFKQCEANLDESSSIREVSPPHTSSRGSRNWAVHNTYRSKSSVRGHVEIVFRNMCQDSQNQLRQMLSWIAIFKHFGGVNGRAWDLRLNRSRIAAGTWLAWARSCFASTRVLGVFQ